MMESLPPIFAREEGAREGGLRVPAWSDLAARLAAARDLRGTLQPERGCDGGSFGRFVSVEREPLNANGPSVNPTGLADGKGAGRNVAASSAGSAPADREMR